MFKPLQKNNYFVLTGAMGAGKSTLLNKLIALNYTCIEEPARPIISQQRNIGGQGIYEKNPALFIELMLSRAIFQFQQAQSYQGPVIFDRGVPDMMGYANLAGIELAHLKKAAELYRYNPIVFFTPAWQEIYTTDDERKMSFEAASEFGENIKKIYLELGYKVIDVPFDTPEMRAEFIINTIKNTTF